MNTQVICGKEKKSEKRKQKQKNVKRHHTDVTCIDSSNGVCHDSVFARYVQS